MTLATSLATLESSGLIRLAQLEPDLEYLFRHALVQEATYASILKTDRRVLHRVVAETLERLYPEHLNSFAFLLGQHWREAGEVERARQYFIRSGEFARKIYANGEAVAAYTEALSLTTNDAERFDLLAARVAVYDVIAARNEQRADIDAMMDLVEKMQDDTCRCDVLLAQADYYLTTEHVLAREPAELALEIARKLDDSLREGRALLRLGSEASMRSDFSESRRWVETAELRFQEAGNMSEKVALLNMMGLVLLNLGDDLAAKRYLEEAVKLSQNLSDRRQEGVGLRRLSIVHLQLNRLDEALIYIEDALKIYRELGDSVQECLALDVLGAIQFSFGRLEQAKTCYYQSLEIAEAIDFTGGIKIAVERIIGNCFRPAGEYETGLTFINRRIEKARQMGHEFLVFDLEDRQVGLLADLGQYSQALEIVFAAQPVAERIGQSAVIGGLLFVCYFQIMLGQFVQARQTLSAIFELTEAIGHPAIKIWSLFNGAALALANGKVNELRAGLEQAKQAISLAAEGNFDFHLVSSYNFAARLHLALGQTDDALVSTHQAVRAIEKFPIPFDYDHAFFTHFRALRANGHDTEADEYLQKTYDRVMLVANKTKDDTLRQSWLENVRENREIIAEWNARHPGQVNR